MSKLTDKKVQTDETKKTVAKKTAVKKAVKKAVTKKAAVKKSPAKKAAPKKGAAPAKKGGLNKDIKINIKLPSFLGGRVKPKDLTTFTRQLATLVNAGLPLMRCIEVLKKQNQIPAIG